jgi:GxxExxY protein
LDRLTKSAPAELRRIRTQNYRGVAFEIYKQFRNNHKEKIYHNAFCLALICKGFKVEKEKQINIYYNNKKVGVYTPDLIVNDSILIELKAKPNLTKQDIEQFWHYLKGSNYKLGFLINFGAPMGVQIIRRVYETARIKTK